MNIVTKINSDLLYQVSTLPQDQENVRILLYCLSALFLVVAVICFIICFIFYQKKTKDNQDLNLIFSKTKSWWIKHRAYVMLCLAILFLLLAIGGFVTVENIIASLNKK